MAISYEQMPERFQREAIQIFADQLNGKISNTEAEKKARANEAAAQQAVAAGATGGSFLTTPPASTGGGATGGESTQPSGETCNGIAKPTAGLFRGYEWYCNPEKGWDTRWTGPFPEPATNEEGREKWAEYDKKQEEEKGKGDPTQKPVGAPQGYDYVWDGSKWVLQEMGTAGGPTRAEQRESARAVVANLLTEYGLETLTDFVTNLITTEDIVSGDVILGKIRQTEQYKARFAGNAARRAAGYNVMSEDQYIAMENQYRQIMRASGLPSGFYDAPDDFTTLIGGDVSAAELSSRINEGYLAVQQANPQVVAELKRLYPVGDGELAAYFLDPEKATPLLLRQARSAQIAAEATLQAQQQLSAATAEELAVAGITQEQARAGFQTIAGAEELFVALPGTTEEAISQQEQISGVFGTSAAAQQRIRQRSRERQATFEAGGRFAGQGTTVTGLQ
jgi:hypothetical protein